MQNGVLKRKVRRYQMCNQCDIKININIHLFRVRFRQISLYLTGQNLYRLFENAWIVLRLCDIWPQKTIELQPEHANITSQDPKWRQTANGLTVMWYPVSHLYLIPRPTSILTVMFCGELFSATPHQTLSYSKIKTEYSLFLVVKFSPWLNLAKFIWNIIMDNNRN
jgi:hypothetical protein